MEVAWAPGPNGPALKRVRGTEFTMPVDLVLLAMGFVHVAHEGLVRQLDLACDRRGNLVVDEQLMTSQSGIFAAGDAAEGASLVVRAIDAGRRAACAIDRRLMSR